MAKDTVWTNIDVTSLDLEHQAAWAEYKAAYRLAKEAKDKFEAGMRDKAGLAQGKLLVFGYNFGKLSLAVVEDDRKAPSQSKVKGLGDFLAAQQAAGRSA